MRLSRSAAVGKFTGSAPTATRFGRLTPSQGRHHTELRHAANSAALLKTPRACYDVARPGMALFGVEPAAGLCPELRPVMRVRTEIAALRDLPAGAPIGYGATFHTTRPSRIATVPVGYADGFCRGLSNRGSLLVRGKRAPVVGTVSMDMTISTSPKSPTSASATNAPCSAPKKARSAKTKSAPQKSPARSGRFRGRS